MKNSGKSSRCQHQHQRLPEWTRFQDRQSRDVTATLLQQLQSWKNEAMLPVPTRLVQRAECLFGVDILKKKKKILTRRWIWAPAWLINPTWLSSVTTRPRACRVELERGEMSWRRRSWGRNNKRVCPDGAPAGSDHDSWFGSDKVVIGFLWSGWLGEGEILRGRQWQRVQPLHCCRLAACSFFFQLVLHVECKIWF